MTISDEKLNAFIDGELSALEMSIVRDAIAKDDHIADRAEALAALNSQITASLSAIDAIPLSAGLSQVKSQLETGAHTEAADNVVSFPWWRQAQAAMTMPTAIAASIAAIFGFFLNSETHTGAGAMSDWSAISQALSNQTSGELVTTNNGSSFEARLTFLNQEGEYCRQFYIKTNNAPALQSIARSVCFHYESRKTRQQLLRLFLIVGGFYSEVALRNERQRAQCILNTS